MTSSEMKYRFKLGLDYITNSKAPGFSDRQISSLLTLAQKEFLDKKLPSSRDTLREVLNETERLKNTFSVLVQSAQLTVTNLSTDQTNIYPNTERYDVPSDFWYSLPSNCTILITSGLLLGCIQNNTISGVNVLPVTEDYYETNIHNPFKCPNPDVIWRLQYKRGNVEAEPTTGNYDKHELVHDSTYSITYYNLRYLRRPKPIIVVEDGTTFSIEGLTGTRNCELDSWCHQDIVDIAVNKAAGYVGEEERWQTSMVEVQENNV